MVLAVVTDTVQYDAATAVGELAVVVCDASVEEVSGSSGSAVGAHSQQHIAGSERVGSSRHTGTVLVIAYVTMRLATALGDRHIL
jgi:hypothetical protein